MTRSSMAEQVAVNHKDESSSLSGSAKSVGMKKVRLSVALIHSRCACRNVF